MTSDEINNCTFEPDVGLQDPHYSFKKQFLPPQEENKTFVDRFGANF